MLYGEGTMLKLSFLFCSDFDLFLCPCRLKIFVPIAFLAFAIMVPVNWTNGTLEHSKLAYSDIDKLSISNIPIGSQRYGELSAAIGNFLFLSAVSFFLSSPGQM